MALKYLYYVVVATADGAKFAPKWITPQKWRTGIAKKSPCPSINPTRTIYLYA